MWPHVVVTPKPKIILLLFHNSKLVVRNRNTNIWHSGYQKYDSQGVETHRVRSTVIGVTIWTRLFVPMTKIPQRNNVKEERFILAHTFRGLIALSLRWGRISLCLDPVSEAVHCLTIKKQERARRQDMFFHGMPSSYLFLSTLLYLSIILLYYKSNNGLNHWLGQSCHGSLKTHSWTHPEVCFISFLGVSQFNQVDSQD